MNRDAGEEVAALYIRVLQIPVCVLLLVQLPLRNQLCLMEFLIVCPEFESWLRLKLREILRSASGRRRQWGAALVFFYIFFPKSHYENTEGCFVSDFGDSVMLAVNNSSSAVNC